MSRRANVKQVQVKDESMNRIAHIGIGLAFLTILLASLAAAQTSSSSVPPGQTSLGDYARKIHKNPSAPKAKPKMFDNDNLPTDDKLSVVGQKPSTEAANSAPVDDKDKADAAAKPEDEQAKKEAAWKDWQNKLTAQKDSIDLTAPEP